MLHRLQGKENPAPIERVFLTSANPFVLKTEKLLEIAFMKKGYTSQEILTQCRRLETAGIKYGFFYLTGISGKGHGTSGAMASAKIFNQLHPFLLGNCETRDAHLQS